MAFGTTTSADLNALFPKIYEKTLLVARAQGIMPALAKNFRDSQGVEDRVFSQRPQLSMQNVAEADDYQAPEKFGKSSLGSITPGEAMGQSLLKWRDVRTDPSAIDDLTTEMGGALATKLDQDLTSVFASFNGGEGVAIGAAGTAITWGHMLAAQAQLLAKSISGRYAVVLHTYQIAALGATVDLRKNLASTPEAIVDELARTWYIGSYQNMDFYATPNITIDASADARGAMFVPDVALALDVRWGPHLGVEHDESDRSTEYNMVIDYGYGVRRANYGIDLLFDATAPTS